MKIENLNDQDRAKSMAIVVMYTTALDFLSNIKQGRIDGDGFVAQTISGLFDSHAVVDTKEIELSVLSAIKEAEYWFKTGRLVSTDSSKYSDIYDNSQKYILIHKIMALSSSSDDKKTQALLGMNHALNLSMQLMSAVGDFAVELGVDSEAQREAIVELASKLIERRAEESFKSDFTTGRTLN